MSHLPPFDYETPLLGRVAISKAMPFFGTYDRGTREYFAFRTLDLRRVAGHNEPDRRDLIACCFYDTDKTYLGACFVDANDPMIFTMSHLLLTAREMRLPPHVDIQTDSEVANYPNIGKLSLDTVDWGPGIQEERSDLAYIFGGCTKEELRGWYEEDCLRAIASRKGIPVEELRQAVVQRGVMKDNSEIYELFKTRSEEIQRRISAQNHTPREKPVLH